MSLVSFHDVSLAYARPLLRHAGFHLDPGEKVALIGPNGCGKSTLFHLLLQTAVPDTGTISFTPDLGIACLGQEPPAASFEGTCGDLLHLTPDLMSQEFRAQMPSPETPLVLEKSFHALLAGLRLSAGTPWSSCSTGQRRRALLARVLAGEPDLLLLDEPTNHLDLPAILFLEEHLKRFAGALVLISHDRSLVRHLAQRIWEIDLTRLMDWRCGYDPFLERREAALEAESKEQNRFEKKLSEEEAWLRQGIKARRTRNEGRVKALELMRREAEERLRRPPQAQMRIQEGGRSGEQVLVAEHLCLEDPHGQPLIRDFSARVRRGDRIGIIGPNGCGKTTLLRLLLGEIEPTSGSLESGTQIQLCRMEQLREQLPEEARVMDVIADGSDRVLFEGRTLHVTSYLNRFLFTADKLRTRVNLLSGGEKARLLMARLFLTPANVLVLDEPTNDLDLETLELLEDLLSSFSGTLILVSHDREFLNNLCNMVWSFEGNGHIGTYAGGYDQATQAGRKPDPASPPSTTAPSPAPLPQTGRERPRRLGYMEKRRLEELPAVLEGLETRKAGILHRLADPRLYVDGTDQVAALNRELEETEAALEAAMEDWVYLERIREAQEGV